MRRPVLPSAASAVLPAALAVLCFAGGAMAQPLYRSVDAQGRVTFSDRPPSASAQPVEIATPSEVETGGDALPYALRQVVQRFPVTLYTQRDCAPCDEGRNMLRNRGVPFRERTVNANADAEALQRLSGQTGLPLLTIGNQQLRGYADAEWAQYLDAAGYPRQSQLPAGYRSPAPRPLIASPAAPAQAAPPPAAPPAPAPSGPTPSNPAGIRF